MRGLRSGPRPYPPNRLLLGWVIGVVSLRVHFGCIAPGLFEASFTRSLLSSSPQLPMLASSQPTSPRRTSLPAMGVIGAASPELVFAGGSNARRRQRPCPRRLETSRGESSVYAGVAQLAEHLFCKQAVRGSSPLPSSSAAATRPPALRNTKVRRTAGGSRSQRLRAARATALRDQT